MSKKIIHILMLAEYYFPFDRGGSEWSVHFLAKELVSKKIQVSIFTPNYGASTVSEIEKVKVYRFPFYKKLSYSNQMLTPWWQSNLLWYIWTVFWLWRFVIKHKPTHIHVQGKYLFPAAVIIAKLYKLPTIASLRDYIALCPYAYCINRNRNFHRCSLQELITLDLKKYTNSSLKKLIFSPLLVATAIRGWVVSIILRYFISKIDINIAVSSRLAEIYRNNNIRIDNIIYNITKTDLKPVQPKDYLLFAGRLTKGKGFDLLIQVYKRKHYILPPLWIAGDGPLLNMIENKPYLKWLGHLKRNILMFYITRAKLVVIPSVWEEPFGRIALEAVSAGVPVVATNVGGLPEIITHYVNGIIVDPNVEMLTQGIQTGLTIQNKLRKYIQKSRPDFRRRFNTQPVSAHISIYKKL